MSVLSVMRNLRAKVDVGNMRPHCFVEVNGLKLASPENIYRVMTLLTISVYVGFSLSLCDIDSVICTYLLFIFVPY